MIRREQGDEWLIISQGDHARVAAELAAAWMHTAVGAAHISDLLIETVRDHDTGWRHWEEAPEIDPQTGIPRSFTEMPMATAAVIWEQSIEYCAREHSLPGIWVSSHFCRLAEQALLSRRDDSDDVAAIERFLAAQKLFQGRCRVAALAEMTQRELESLVTFGTWYLRLFDGLSLWLCCAERSRPLVMRFNEQSVRLIPRSVAEISLDPYVLTQRPLSFTVPARRIPARSYGSNEELQSTLNAAPMEELRWMFDQ